MMWLSMSRRGQFVSAYLHMDMVIAKREQNFFGIIPTSTVEFLVIILFLSLLKNMPILGLNLRLADYESSTVTTTPTVFMLMKCLT